MEALTFSMFRLLWIGLNVAWEWIMLFKNGSLSIWDFEFEIGVLDYLTNIDQKFLFVKSFDVIYVLELIKKKVLSLF